VEPQNSGALLALTWGARRLSVLVAAK
jgi:hypothetical protein